MNKNLKLKLSVTIKLKLFFPRVMALGDDSIFSGDHITNLSELKLCIVTLLAK